MTYVCLSLYVLRYPFIYWSILSISVQITLYNLFELEFEVIYFWNSIPFLLAWSQIISIASKSFDMIQV
jgi:hypothetical protein